MVAVLRCPTITKFQACFLSEGIGTFMLVLTAVLSEISSGGLAINGTTHTRDLAPLATGFMATVISEFGDISGGHFNPAVSLGFLLVGSIRLELAVAYWVAQLVGGFLAACLALGISGETRRYPCPQVFENKPAYVITGFFAEAVFSCALVTVVLHVALSGQRNNHYYGAAIGFCVLAAAYAVGGVSGGSFNPAVATSTQLVRCFTGNCIPLVHLWLYWAAPAAGAFGASLLYKMIYRDIPSEHGAH